MPKITDFIQGLGEEELENLDVLGVSNGGAKKGRYEVPEPAIPQGGLVFWPANEAIPTGWIDSDQKVGSYVLIRKINDIYPTVINRKITVTSWDANGFTLNWSKAYDAIDSDGDLNYQIYSSYEDDLDTDPQTVEFNGILRVVAFGQTSLTVAWADGFDFQPDTVPIWINIIVKNTRGFRAIYTATDYFATGPQISNATIEKSVTNTDYTIDVAAATDFIGRADPLEYIVVEGTLEELSDPELIQQLPVVASGFNTTQFTVTHSAGWTGDVGVYVKDVVGNVSLYSPVNVRLLDPEIISIDVDPSSIEGSVGDTGTISWNVTGDETTSQQELATPSSSNTSRLTLSNIDKNAGTADYQLVGAGSGEISVVSDFDGFTTDIPFNVIADELANDSETISATTA